MSDLFLGIADPEFWRNCGYALLAIGLIGAVAVILLLDRKPRLQKGLALLFIAVVLAGLGVARFGTRPLWEELDQALRAANWVRVAPSGLAVGDPPAGIPLSPNSGVTVFVTASRANELAPTAHALAAALMAEGLIAGVTASAGPRMEQRPNVIVIEIGRKPS